MRTLLVNQTFPPDVAATAQYAGELARELAARGHEVTAIAARGAYDAPEVRFQPKEDWHGVRVVRVPCSGFGKRTASRRAVDFGSFLVSAAARMAVMPRFDVVVAMTTPPLLPVLGALLTRLRGGRLVVWLMDLNPDEAVAAGWLRKGSLAERVLSRLSGWSLRRADAIVVLDRFMRERVVRQGVPEHKISVIPPWANSCAVDYDLEGRDEFRRRHGLSGKFVVMYSGNHSPCHPLDTLLEAAERLGNHHRGAARHSRKQSRTRGFGAVQGDRPTSRESPQAGKVFTESCKQDGTEPAAVQGDRPTREIVFCFVGGGSELGKVKAFARERGLENIVCLPYQPLDALSASLSAADLHVVAMGDPFVGIVHPCKIYNILALGIPFLYIGPEVSHITEILPAERAWAARHGDVGTVVSHLLSAARDGAGQRYSAEMRLAQGFSQNVLLPKLVECVAHGAEGRACRQAKPPAPQWAARRGGG